MKKIINKISPIVITSKQATKHLDKIKIEHGDLLKAIQNQQSLTDQFTREETMNKQIEETQSFERKNSEQKMFADNEKGRIEAETRRLSEINKQKELAIKEQALNTE